MEVHIVEAHLSDLRSPVTRRMATIQIPRYTNAVHMQHSILSEGRLGGVMVSVVAVNPRFIGSIPAEVKDF
jgi:hypothetical protein